VTDQLLQPTLTGQMVHIEPLSAEHYDALFAVASDPLIWEQHPAHDRWRPEVFRKLFDSGLESSGALLVRDVATKEVIGSSRYYAWQPAERHVSIGYTFLARRCWGGTYNHEMKRLMLEHAFGFVDTVWFHIGIANIRSRRAIAAIGAQLSHEVENDPAHGGLSMAYYSITRNRVYNRRPSQLPPLH
jgi:RimJ/RimL family protein N-acetyltransferase